jgi:hypothetical protein
MAITYHAGRRIQGTQADFDGTPAVSGGWKEVGRTTLGSTQTTIDVSSLDDKRYLMVLIDGQIAGSTNSAYILNNSTSGYATRKNYNGGTDNVSDVNFSLARTNGWGQALPEFNVMYMSNLVNKDKSIINHGVGQSTAGAGASPTRSEIVTKWTGTDVIDQITAVDYNNSGSGYASGSEVVVLGYDPDDSHTSNFWTELASADWSSGYQINSGTFTAKKYLRIQGWYKNAANTGYARFRVGNNTIDDDVHYANRYNSNGTSETGEINNDAIYVNVTNTDASSGLGFFNMFIINNASNEKLVIGHHTLAVSGVANAPIRQETVAKWNETSDQINVVELHRYGGNNFTAGGIKVWGSN